MKLLASPFTWMAVAALFLFGTIWQCNRAAGFKEGAKTAEARATEAARAVEADVPIVAQVKDAKARAEALAAENSDLKTALARALAAIPGATVVETVHAVVEGAAHGPPRPQSKTCQCPELQTTSAPGLPPGAHGAPASCPSRDTEVGAAGAAAGSTSSPAASPCLLVDNDHLKLELDGVVLKGPSGAHYFTGTEGARRSSDGYLLLREPVTSGGTTVEEQAAPAARAPGWAYGLGAGGSLGGVLGAVLVQTHPFVLPLLHWPARAWALGAAGASQGLVLAGVSVEP